MIKTMFVCFVVFALLSPPPAFSSPIGTISKFSGEVYYRVKDTTSYELLKATREISEGSWIKTGKAGWAELNLIDKSRFTIANNSELEFVHLQFDKSTRDGLFSLTKGKLRASVAPSHGLTSTFKLKSRGAVAGVKGTEFLMLSEGPASVFFGNEGRVEISGNDETGKILQPQYMTQSTRGLPPIDPVAVEPNTPIATVKADFESITSLAPPAEWAASDNLTAIIARWNINYGHYLADTGKYEQALQVFQIALDLAKEADIQCDARLERSAVYSRFLRNPEAALVENQLILDEYPNAVQAESALYNTGQILFELPRKEQAKERFKEYLQKYPGGKHKNNVETLLGILSQ